MNNNQEINPINNQNQEIVPIKEIEIQQQVNIETPINNLTNINNQPPKNNKISTVLLIILFIALFLFVIFMPEITKFIEDIKSKEEIPEIKQETPINTPTPTQTPIDEKLTELNCTLTNTENINYTLMHTQKFTYNNKNQVINSSYQYEYIFNTIDENYESLKQQCNNILNYINHNGYTPSCNYDNNNITISHEFDLEIFTPIADNNTILVNATYKQDINEIKNSLISQGYTCN